MAEIPGLQLTGDADLNKRLLAMPDKMLNTVLKKAVRKGARRIVTAARRKLRAQDAIETGLLAKSLRIGVRIRRKEGVIVAKVIPKKRVQGFGPDGRKRVPKFYAHLIEFGHDVKAWGAVHGHVPARPFMRPALDENRQKILGDFDENVRNFLAKELAKPLKHKTAAGARIAAQGA